MPTYEYKCSACEHGFEEFQAITADPVKKCPACGKLKVQRLIGSGAALIFKGSGFYETDYRSDNYKKAAKADSEKSAPKKTDAKDTSTTTKSDTKKADKK